MVLRKGKQHLLAPQSEQEQENNLQHISVGERNRCNKIKQSANSALPVSETQSVVRPSGKSSTALFFRLESEKETLMFWRLSHTAQTAAGLQ